MRPIRFRFSMATTESEYRANLSGLNTFFGAVLGFVVSSFESLDLRTYVALLVVCSTIVVTILYMSSSPNRWTYLVLSVGLIASLPSLIPEGAFSPQKLQATFAVWLVLTLIFEFSPRQPEGERNEEPTPSAKAAKPVSDGLS